LNSAFKYKSIAHVIHPFKTSSKKPDSHVTTDEFGLQLRSEIYSRIPGKANDHQGREGGTPQGVP
jgi:hypothetical protein